MFKQERFPVIFQVLNNIHTEVINMYKKLPCIWYPYSVEEHNILWRTRCSLIELRKPQIDNISLFLYLDDKIPKAYIKGKEEELWHLILTENKLVENMSVKNRIIVINRED